MATSTMPKFSSEIAKATKVFQTAKAGKVSPARKRQLLKKISQKSRAK